MLCARVCERKKHKKLTVACMGKMRLMNLDPGGDAIMELSLVAVLSTSACVALLVSPSLPSSSSSLLRFVFASLNMHFTVCTGSHGIGDEILVFSLSLSSSLFPFAQLCRVEGAGPSSATFAVVVDDVCLFPSLSLE